MEKQDAIAALSEKYNVEPDALQYAFTWTVPEMGKVFMTFMIVDQHHKQYGSSVSHAVCQKPY
jgi:hypothetical protein